MKRLGRDEFLGRARSDPVVPVYRQVLADTLTPVLVYASLVERGEPSFLFESVEKGERSGRYSFLGVRPGDRLELSAAGEILAGFARAGSRPLEETPGGLRPPGSCQEFFTALRRLVGRGRPRPDPVLPPFTGGAVGYLSYDCVRLIERLPSRFPDPPGPRALFFLFDTVIAFDHLTDQITLIRNVFVAPDADPGALFDAAERDLDLLEAALERPAPPAAPPCALDDALRAGTSRPEFLAAVGRIKEHIAAGDAFQVVLSQEFTIDTAAEPLAIYRALRHINPSPYLFLLDTGGFSLVGSSPEALVRVVDSRATLRPIAGTRVRGSDQAADLGLAAELAADPKELAEHAMLVDLGRNDLGRVCRYGSVRIVEPMHVERYSHVMHLVTELEGELDAGRDALDALIAAFPAGTVSGAPKIRAMQIIDEVEPSGRWIYAGAVGYLDFHGNLDTCIAIRTLVHEGRRVRLRSGAGIVADSVADREFDETLNKARALVEAVRLAERGLR